MRLAGSPTVRVVRLSTCDQVGHGPEGSLRRSIDGGMLCDMHQQVDVEMRLVINAIARVVPE